MRPGRDVLLEEGPADPFDPATSAARWVKKMASTPTRKLASE